MWSCLLAIIVFGEVGLVSKITTGFAVFRVGTHQEHELQQGGSFFGRAAREGVQNLFA
jgi:hypothetical protein